MDFSGFEEFLSRLTQLTQQGTEFVVCTVVDSSGSTPRKSGAKMIVTLESDTYGTIGGGSVESAVINNAKEIIKKRGPNQLLKFELNQKGVGVCGGSVSVFLEGVYNKYKLIIFGAGHVSEAVCDILKRLDYSITVFDNRRERLQLSSFAQCKKVCSEYEKMEDLISTDEKTDILIMTPNHQYDFEITKRMLRRPSRFLGVIGSKRKKSELYNYLKENGFSENEINKVKIPVGIEIGSKTPYEIAISIAAELISLNSESQK